MPNENRALTGTSGNVWLNGKRLAMIKKIELKLTGSFEDVGFCGDPATYSIFTGYSGDGSITLQKVDSMVLSLLSDAYSSGVMPDIKIITKLTDRATGQSERSSVENVVFTEFHIANFEQKALVEEEIPLKFAKYRILEKIAEE